MEDELLIQIEEARQKMYRFSSLFGLSGRQVLEQSQVLDGLLNLIQNMKERDA